MINNKKLKLASLWVFVAVFSVIKNVGQILTTDIYVDSYPDMTQKYSIVGAVLLSIVFIFKEKCAKYLSEKTGKYSFEDYLFIIKVAVISLGIVLISNLLTMIYIVKTVGS